MTTAKTKKRLKWRWLAYAVLLILVLIAGFKIYSHFSIAANKRAFQNARQTIDNVYYDAIKQVGMPDDAKISSSCSRSHEEFGSGILSCDLNVNFIYGVNDQNQASLIFKKVQTDISSNHKDLKPTRPLAQSIKDSIVVSTTYHAASDTYKSYGLDCTVNYVYDTPREIDLAIKDTNKKPFEITLGCYGPAKQQYYRLAS